MFRSMRKVNVVVILRNRIPVMSPWRFDEIAGNLTILNLLRVMYLVVKFVVDLELMARVGEVPCLALSQARSKKSRFFGVGP